MQGKIRRLRIDPITGGISVSWPLFVPSDEHALWSPLGDSNGARCQNFVTVGLCVIIMTWASWRCVMTRVHDSLSSAGKMGEAAAVGMVR